MNTIKKNQMVKAVMAVVCALSITLGLLGVVASVIMADYDAYNSSYKEFNQYVLRNAVEKQLVSINDNIMGEDSIRYLAQNVEERNLGVDVSVSKSRGHDHPEFNHEHKICSSYDSSRDYQFHFDTVLWPADGRGEYTVRVYVHASPAEGSLAYQLSALTRAAYDNRYRVVAASALLGIISLILLVLLMIGAGHRKEDDEIHSRWIDRGMWDLNLFLTISIIAIINIVPVEVVFYDYKLGVIMLFFSCLVSAFLGILCMMSLAVQCKTGVIIKKSLIGICAVTAYKAARWLAVRLVKVWNQLTASIPRTWKSFLLLGIFLVATIVAVLSDSLLLLLLEILIAVPVIGYLIVNTDQMDKITENIAHGQFGEKLNPKKLFGASKKRAENLNSIDEAVSRAVEERMKSEHFKTELITNVSHDLKTPLTSIISYSELLKQHNEEGDSQPDEVASEYIDVIYSNALRLKKLASDIVEASKASSGSMEVELAELDLGMLMSQCIGEYNEKLEQAGLQLVSSIDQGITIQADGKLMWRVIDNLFSNICKYSASGSRVYVDVKKDQGESGKAEVVFRNVSASELNITADELMERFIRGDASRNTEGSGLGLSIAQSLMELQGGTMEITIDGDLFKATLRI